MRTETSGGPRVVPDSWLPASTGQRHRVKSCSRNVAKPCDRWCECPTLIQVALAPEGLGVEGSCKHG